MDWMSGWCLTAPAKAVGWGPRIDGVAGLSVGGASWHPADPALALARRRFAGCP